MYKSELCVFFVKFRIAIPGLGVFQNSQQQRAAAQKPGKSNACMQRSYVLTEDMNYNATTTPYYYYYEYYYLRALVANRHQMELVLQ